MSIQFLLVLAIFVVILAVVAHSPFLLGLLIVVLLLYLLAG